jgi:hypothetical protein
MEKLDFRKANKAMYGGKPGQISVITLPELPYLTVTGRGDPDLSPDFATAVAALYALSYGVKFLAKAALGQDHVVSVLEGQWWADDMADFINTRRVNWRWKLMVRQPDWISAEMVETARQAKLTKLARDKAPATTPAMLTAVQLERIDEGPCLQVLHIGPYADEAPLIAHLHEVEMPARGLRFGGHHHEIYLNDRRKVAPAGLKTLLRQPVVPA